MLSHEKDEQGKRLNNQHAFSPGGKSTNRYDQEHWDRLREQTALLREHLLLAWEKAQELIDQRWQIAQDHQDLRLQRQHLLEQQATYLDGLAPF